jgi:hypothetical protein
MICLLIFLILILVCLFIFYTIYNKHVRKLSGGLVGVKHESLILSVVISKNKYLKDGQDNSNESIFPLIGVPKSSKMEHDNAVHQLINNLHEDESYDLNHYITRNRLTEHSCNYEGEHCDKSNKGAHTCIGSFFIWMKPPTEDVTRWVNYNGFNNYVEVMSHLLINELYKHFTGSTKMNFVSSSKYKCTDGVIGTHANRVNFHKEFPILYNNSPECRCLDKTGVQIIDENKKYIYCVLLITLLLFKIECEKHGIIIDFIVLYNPRPYISHNSMQPLINPIDGISDDTVQPQTIPSTNE